MSKWSQSWKQKTPRVGLYRKWGTSRETLRYFDQIHDFQPVPNTSVYYRLQGELLQISILCMKFTRFPFILYSTF